MSIQTDPQILFSNVAIRLYNLKKISTKRLTILDLFRDEIKLLISITILNQLQSLIIKKSPNLEFNTQDSVKLFIRKILLRSKRKILNKLGDLKFKYRQAAVPYSTLQVLTQFENYKPLLLLFAHFADIKYLKQNKVPIQLLLEHTILQLSNIMLYDIFLNMELSNCILDTYTVDPILFTSYISKIKIYLAGKLYLNGTDLTRKVIIPDTTSLFILTESGITEKKIKFKSISRLLNSQTAFICFLSRVLHLIEKISYNIIECLVKR